MVLVLIGGQKIPENRRLMMPGMSVAVLLCGVMSTFSEDITVRVLWYSISSMVVCIMFFFNAKQIMEHSGGEETIWQGESEFRKATLILIGTWFPFPLWYILSPEGLDLINDGLTIQLGWSFLNILAKGSFIFYIQRTKDAYFMREQNRKENYGVTSVSPAYKTSETLEDHLSDDDDRYSVMDRADSIKKPQQQQTRLGAMVHDVMAFRGMGKESERLVRLLNEAEIHTVTDVERLTREQCDDMKLPWDLVQALQKRIRGRKNKTAGEIALEKSEEFYNKNRAHQAAQFGPAAAKRISNVISADDGMVHTNSMTNSYVNGHVNNPANGFTNGDPHYFQSRNPGPKGGLTGGNGLPGGMHEGHEVEMHNREGGAPMSAREFLMQASDTGHSTSPQGQVRGSSFDEGSAVLKQMEEWMSQITQKIDFIAAAQQQQTQVGQRLDKIESSLDQLQDLAVQASKRSIRAEVAACSAAEDMARELRRMAEQADGNSANLIKSVVDYHGSVLCRLEQLVDRASLEQMEHHHDVAQGTFMNRMEELLDKSRREVEITFKSNLNKEMNNIANGEKERIAGLQELNRTVMELCEMAQDNAQKNEGQAAKVVSRLNDILDTGLSRLLHASEGPREALLEVLMRHTAWIKHEMTSEIVSWELRQQLAFQTFSQMSGLHRKFSSPQSTLRGRGAANDRKERLAIELGDAREPQD
eukprot:gnl/TRDRNA2_/TRDRNA2_125565_c0_seq1.p1 gnl/TRDRNA2_/TRDRNA2_125565_c0~~gnl/TRDRNA2_/TRDRNA2_125565_c0_seq1.p1  ORF type:complete len:814 (-),score=173.33 gnl/TRDRNA2_/TRDRNA2_125565_c0_seq1:320-2422(-)